MGTKMLRWSLVSMTVVLAMGAFSLAQAQDSDLAVTFNNDFVTKYMWRGYDLFDDHASWQPSLDFDLMGSGWHFNIWGAQPIGSGNEDLTELDYTVYYENSVYEGEPYQVDYTTQYIYYDYPKTGSDADAEEIGVNMAFPNILGDSGVVPSYYISKIWLAQGGDKGAFHIFSLDYTMDCPMTGLPINLHWDLTYNDGFAGVDHDWTHQTLSASTDVDVADNISISPFVAFQVTMDNSLPADEDELYGGIKTSISF